MASRPAARRFQASDQETVKGESKPSESPLKTKREALRARPISRARSALRRASSRTFGSLLEKAPWAKTWWEVRSQVMAATESSALSRRALRSASCAYMAWPLSLKSSAVSGDQARMSSSSRLTSSMRFSLAAQETRSSILDSGIGWAEEFFSALNGRMRFVTTPKLKGLRDMCQPCGMGWISGETYMGRHGARRGHGRAAGLAPCVIR